MEDEELKNKLVIAIANQMKKSYVNWNLDTVEDEVIFNQSKKIIKQQTFEIPEGTELIKIRTKPKATKLLTLERRKKKIEIIETNTETK